MGDPSLCRRRLLATSTIGLAAAVAGCGGDADGNTVTVAPDRSLSFDPADLTISTGETVTFEWDSDGHNLNPTDVPEGADWNGEQDLRDEGHTHEHTFDVAGTYEYQCDPHAASGMTGTITVQE